jgi:hypothetical protein
VLRQCSGLSFCADCAGERFIDGRPAYRPHRHRRPGASIFRTAKLVDECCNVYVAEESGHLAAFGAAPRLTVVKS